MADLTPIHEALGRSEGKHQALQPGELSLRLRDELGNRLTFNELTLAPEVDGQTVPGNKLDELYVAFSERGWKIEKGKAIDALMRAARENAYHPVAQYLEHIAQDDGIEPADLNSLATTYLATTDRLYDQMLAATLIGAVARIMEPGCKFDNCCVLLGPQGIGKSTTWQALASPALFCDTAQEGDKDLRLAIHTCWIYELAELDAVTNRKEAAAVKALLSSAVDTFRPPYGRSIDKHPRRSIMVGSCNRDDFLRDETGSRRFWVIELKNRIDTHQLTVDRDRIWRAAVLACQAGMRPILSNEYQTESERRNMGYAPEHPWLALLSRWMLAAPTEFTTDQALVGAMCVAHDRIERRHQMEITPLLKSLGFSRDKHQTRDDGGSRPRYWRRTTQPASSSSAEVETGQTPAHQSDLAQPSQPLNLNSKLSIKYIEGVDAQKSSKQVERLRQPVQPSIPGQMLTTKAEAWHTPALKLYAADPAKLPWQIALGLEAKGYCRIKPKQIEDLIAANPSAIIKQITPKQ